MKRKLLIVGAATVLVGGAVAGFVLTRGSASKGSAANAGLPPATATVTRTNLVATKTETGTLGYGDPIPLRANERGIVTWIAPLGSTVRRGKPLAKINQRPLVVLYGTLPLYRPLLLGTTGRDVRELERNLAALGYGGFTVNGTYTVATEAAVRRWQAHLGLPETGIVAPGQAVFAPGPIRIAAQVARVGDMVGGGPVLSYTGTARQVTVDLDVADQALAVKGRTVTVTPPNRGPVRGKISQVGSVVTAPSPTPDQGSGSEGASSTASDTRIEVTVTIADQKGLGRLQAATVDIDFVSGRRAGVLAVPVAALLALPGGGFGVQMVKGATTRIVPVKTGMFAAGQVEISGKGISAGVKVGVPK